jgi:hypothetical protein
MTVAVSDLLARHRRGVLIAGGALLVLVAMTAGAVPEPTVVIAGLLVGLVALVVLGAVTATSDDSRPPAVVLSVPDRTIGTPRTGGLVLLGLAHLTVATIPAGFAAQAGATGDSWVGLAVMTGLVLAVFPLYARGLWHGTGVTLSPYGIRLDTNAGRYDVPWDAVAAEQPAQRHGTDGRPDEIRLLLARPDLVRRTRMTTGRDTIRFHTARSAFVAAVLAHYALHHDRRHAIGTGAELERLHLELGGGLVAPGPVAPVPSLRSVVIRAVIGLAGLLGMVTVTTWLNDGIWSLSTALTLPSLLAVHQLRTAWDGWRARRQAPPGYTGMGYSGGHG